MPRKQKQPVQAPSILLASLQKQFTVDRVRLRSDAGKILSLLGARHRELSLLLVDDEGIKEINRTYLGKNRPTNVIAFSLSEGEFGGVNESILGDVVVSVQTAGREAEAAGISVYDAVLNLIIHGVLHLAGFDHVGPHRKGRARVMSAVQEEVFCQVRGYRLEVSL